jgi:hypothetical protein
VIVALPRSGAKKLAGGSPQAAMTDRRALRMAARWPSWPPRADQGVWELDDHRPEARPRTRDHQVDVVVGLALELNELGAQAVGGSLDAGKRGRAGPDVGIGASPGEVDGADAGHEADLPCGRIG